MIMPIPVYRPVGPFVSNVPRYFMDRFAAKAAPLMRPALGPRV